VEGRPAALNLEDARVNLAALAVAGVTVARDTGSPKSVTLALPASGGKVQLLPCGRFLAPQHQYFSALHDPVPPEALLDAALAEIAAGARWVKLIGDFPMLGRTGRQLTKSVPTYGITDIRRLVESVHDAQGGAWTPTLCAAIGPRPDEDPQQRERRLRRRDRLGHLLRVAADLGVTIMAGSDVAGSIPQVALMTELGLEPEAALAAASTAAHQFLKMGGLHTGELADLVTYDHDPREDPQVLTRPAAVVVRDVRIR
jgi:hypothetical protein